MSSLLTGLKILDFTTLLPGPFATMALADLGADVVRIESPTRMDLARIMPPFVDDKSEISYFHAYVNRNKKSVALDLKNKDAFSVIERMLTHYDIIIEQFRPGVMDRLGLSYKRLSSINPGLIYCSLTGYGQTGHLKDRAGHDINYLSLSGIMGYSGRKESGPTLMGIQVADVGSGSNNAIIGILAAYIYRMTTGKGQHIDVAMTDGLFPYHATCASKKLCSGEDMGYETEPLNGGSLYGFYKTADERYLSFGGLEPQFFSAFCKALGVEDLIEATVLQPGRLDEARKRVKDIIKAKPLNYWTERFKGTDACVEPVLSLSEALDSDLVKERSLLVDVPGPGGKPITQIAHPIKFSETSPEYKRAGCELGKDTLDVLQSLGYSTHEIGTMESKGVFGEITT
ncbi:MAG: CaiB/BaiF CoA-transferase family protein [Thermodesulfobacteriota bacterium]|nr:CaiB/BaiF CoA-transferase family protein [Thermodesulfobacteriota bacterium]